MYRPGIASGGGCAPAGVANVPRTGTASATTVTAEIRRANRSMAPPERRP